MFAILLLFSANAQALTVTDFIHNLWQHKIGHYIKKKACPNFRNELKEIFQLVQTKDKKEKQVQLNQSFLNNQCHKNQLKSICPYREKALSLYHKKIGQLPVIG